MNGSGHEAHDLHPQTHWVKDSHATERQQHFLQCVSPVHREKHLALHVKVTVVALSELDKVQLLLDTS